MILLAHGGAGRNVVQDPTPFAEGLCRALFQGSQGEGVRTVIETIRCLEDDPLWNAGKGAVLAEDGLPRLDASLAFSDGRVGAVANLLRIQNPIEAAELVLLRSRHSFLCGEEAEKWLEKEDMLLSSPQTRILPEEKDLLRRSLLEEIDNLCTVGAVSLDKNGALAAGTSTGGIRGKTPGRIGDSAVVGAGTWCSPRCAISMTGDGDTILSRSSAARIALAIERGGKPRQAIRHELRELERAGAAAGCIVLLDSGKSWMMRNCATLHAARLDKNGIFIPLASG